MYRLEVLDDLTGSEKCLVRYLVEIMNLPSSCGPSIIGRGALGQADCDDFDGGAVEAFKNSKPIGNYFLSKS